MTFGGLVQELLIGAEAGRLYYRKNDVPIDLRPLRNRGRLVGSSSPPLDFNSLAKSKGSYILALTGGESRAYPK